MHQTGTFPLADGTMFDLLELPYAGGRLSLLAILPRDPAGFGAMIEALSAEGLGRAIAALRPTSVDVILPRLSTRSALRLEGVLATLGMPRVFTERAELGGIARGVPLRLSTVFQQANIVIDEVGTRGGATTAAAGVVILGDRPEPARFHANRPFAYAVLDRIGESIVFLGSKVK